uniref:Uncharacterized protein n=1 Tax=Chromera velia CCMP2878 TaxID=1169474 RepID=A0A0G4HDP2_9ALVE|eukprot:Cvel_26442.t1-p1 / transcript=Cvel_26442.t1 / gene=Cvel_26442 / organism=Chromera_velia_CCMP2878 / gene_product=hypothetical protein / transcript_product=hypothetical protein / location=Cvel_scaffold3143:4628-5582(+) / protein_length=117 / sequence_SO=supercontig / SO=protein_coding / is_pseudo=false
MLLTQDESDATHRLIRRSEWSEFFPGQPAPPAPRESQQAEDTQGGNPPPAAAAAAGAPHSAQSRGAGRRSTRQQDDQMEGRASAEPASSASWKESDEDGVVLINSRGFLVVKTSHAY